MKAILDDNIQKCKQHDFILKPIIPNVYYHKKVQIIFCDGTNKKINKKSQYFKSKCHLNYAIFNKDRNYATPAFIEQSQQRHFIQNKKNYIKDHSRKIQQYEQLASDLYFPIPRSNNQYCNVCCTPYKNYIQHISSFQHHKKIKINKFNDYIIDLEIKVKKNLYQKNHKRNYSDRYIQIQDDDEIQQSFHKKIKTQQKTDTTTNHYQYHKYQQYNNNLHYPQYNPRNPHNPQYNPHNTLYNPHNPHYNLHNPQYFHHNPQYFPHNPQYFPHNPQYFPQNPEYNQNIAQYHPYYHHYYEYNYEYNINNLNMTINNLNMTINNCMIINQHQRIIQNHHKFNYHLQYQYQNNNPPNHISQYNCYDLINNNDHNNNHNNNKYNDLNDNYDNLNNNPYNYNNNSNNHNHLYVQQNNNQPMANYHNNDIYPDNIMNGLNCPIDHNKISQLQIQPNHIHPNKQLALLKLSLYSTNNNTYPFIYNTQNYN